MSMWIRLCVLLTIFCWAVIPCYAGLTAHGLRVLNTQCPKGDAKCRSEQTKKIEELCAMRRETVRKDPDPMVKLYCAPVIAMCTNDGISSDGDFSGSLSNYTTYDSNGEVVVDAYGGISETERISPEKMQALAQKALKEQEETYVFLEQGDSAQQSESPATNTGSELTSDIYADSDVAEVIYNEESVEDAPVVKEVAIDDTKTVIPQQDIDKNGDQSVSSKKQDQLTEIDKIRQMSREELLAICTSCDFYDKYMTKLPWNSPVSTENIRQSVYQQRIYDKFESLNPREKVEYMEKNHEGIVKAIEVGKLFVPPPVELVLQAAMQEKVTPQAIAKLGVDVCIKKQKRILSLLRNSKDMYIAAGRTDDALKMIKKIKKIDRGLKDLAVVGNVDKGSQIVNIVSE